MRTDALSVWMAAHMACCCAAPSPAETVLIGGASVPGDARDRSCLAGESRVRGLGVVPHDRLGSFGSAIDYTGADDLYVCADDRGPGDGAVQFRARLQTFRLRIDAAAAGTASAVRVEHVATTLLSDGTGHPLVGASAALEPSGEAASLRYDPEGLRIGPGGLRYVSDEYGPAVDAFDAAGRRLRRLVVPARFRSDHPDDDPVREMPPHASLGRQANRGFEGLAISPDGSTLWAVLQSPLIQDACCEPGPKNERRGRNVRILELKTAGGASRELVYPLHDAAHGVNELLAIDDHRLLVLERDGAARTARAVYRVDLASATDVSGVERLPAVGLPEGVRAVEQSLVLDLNDPKFGLAGGGMPEKIEGMTFGPRLPDGRRTLIVTTDNDMRADEPSLFWVFAAGDADLIGPVRQDGQGPSGR